TACSRLIQSAPGLSARAKPLAPRAAMARAAVSFFEYMAFFLLLIFKCGCAAALLNTSLGTVQGSLGVYQIMANTPASVAAAPRKRMHQLMERSAWCEAF